MQYGSTNVESERDDIVDAWSANEDDVDVGRFDAEDDDVSLEKAPRKRVRIRVPVVRSRSARQHKLTVVRRRPLTSRTESPEYMSTAHAPRRIVVTRVRSLGLSKSSYPINNLNSAGFQPTGGKHKVTITRRRKLQPTPILPTSSKSKVRVTRKKLVAVRPILPTPTFAIITAGFFTAPSSEYDEEYSEEEETSEEQNEEKIVKEENHTVSTPGLEETPNLIDNKPHDETNLASLEISSTIFKESTLEEPVIITDNFFFPPSSKEEDDEYEDDYNDSTTTTESVDEIALLEKDQQQSTTEAISPKEEDNIVSNKSESEMQIKNDDNTETTTPINQIALEKPPEEPEESEEAVKTSKESDDALINTVTSVDSTLEEKTTTESFTEPSLSDKDMPITTIIPIEENNDDKATSEEHTTVANLEEPTTLMDDLVTLSVLDKSSESTESTELPDEENTTYPTTIPNTTESHIFSVTEPTTPKVEVQSEESPVIPVDFVEHQMPVDVSNESPEEIPTVRPIQPDIKLDFSSTQIPETVLLSNDTIAPSFDSVIPLETAKLSTREPDTSNYRYDDSSIPSVIPLGANYSRDAKSPIPESTSVIETTPATKVTSKIASPTPEEIEAGLADDLYLSLSRLDFPEILPSKPATVDSETEHTPDLALEPSTSVYYTETVVTSTRLRTYTYVVTQLNGLETKVTSSTTVRPRVTTLTLTVPVTVTVTPTVESSASFVSSVYNPVPVAGE